MRFASIASALLLTLALTAGASAIEITADSVTTLSSAAKTLKPGESKKAKITVDGEEIEVTIFGTATGILVSSSKLTANLTFAPLADGTIAVTVTVSGSSTSTVLALSTDGKLSKADSFAALLAKHGGLASNGGTNPPAGGQGGDDAKGGNDSPGGTITLTGGPSDTVIQNNHQNDGQTTHEIHNGTASPNRPQ